MTHPLLISLLIAGALTLHAADAKNSATGLTSDYRVNPLGIERHPPTLAWKVDASGRAGVMQSAYQIQSAATRNDLVGGRAVWDTGRIESGASWQTPYGGPAPGPGQGVWWRVRIWDEAGKEGDWSEPAWFEAGLLGEKGWQGADWITCGRDQKAPVPAPAEFMGDWIESPQPGRGRSFFRDINLPDKPIVSAMAWWDTSLSPGLSGVVVNFDRQQGENLAALKRSMSARKGGFFDMAFFLEAGRENRIELRFEKPVKAIAATIGMRIVFADGTEMVVKSSPEWNVLTADSPAKPEPVRVRGSYGKSGEGEAMVQAQTSLPPAWFRHGFEAREGLTSARLYLATPGYAHGFLNGQPASDAVWPQPQADYEVFCHYTVDDVTALVRPGKNSLAVLMDAGWFHQAGGFGAIMSYGLPALQALLVLHYADGTSEVVKSGPDWTWKESVIREANIYRGERADLRLADNDWKSGAPGSGWRPVRFADAPSPRSVAVDVAPMRRIAEVRPVRAWRIGPETWIYDFGEVIHGTPRIRFDLPAGKVVRVRFSEMTAKDGPLENVPTSHWWCHGVPQTLEVTAAGGPAEYEPTFCTHSFRYVEVSGIDHKLDGENIVAHVIGTDGRPLASFESSDPMLNRLFANGMRTVRNYMNHMTGDLPRERCLWGAESMYSAVPLTYCYDFAPNHRYMHTLWSTGRMAEENVPGSIGVGLRITHTTNDFTWSVTPIFIAEKLFRHYGDIEPARTHYAFMRGFLRHFEDPAHSKDGVWPLLHKHGDHAPPKDIPREDSDNQFIAALHFYKAQKAFAGMADALGHSEDAAHARDHAERIRAAILTRYDASRGSFGNGVHNSLVLAFDVLDDPAQKQRVADALAEIYRANGKTFDAGFMGHEILPQLTRSGHPDIAHEMIVNPSAPGPARSIEKFDATTFWEAYYLDESTQKCRGLNFVAFTHPIGWMVTDLAGIRYDSPVGQRQQVNIQPHFPKGLDWVRSTLEIPPGQVGSSWKRESERVVARITIPANTTATIRPPSSWRIADGQPESTLGPGEHTITFEPAPEGI